MAAFASAYSLGKHESGAAVNLLKFIPQPVKTKLTELVRWGWGKGFFVFFTPKSPDSFGSGFHLITVVTLRSGDNAQNWRTFTMQKFITHECISSKLFNAKHSSATGTLMPWANVLTNSEPSLTLLLKRLESDYMGIQSKSRKAWGLKDVASWF